VDVAVTPAALEPETLAGASALVIDVLRASTTMITALANGCAAIVPVAELDEAHRRAAAIPGALRGGERHGEAPPGFDLGNSPLEFTSERVRGRTLVFTTSNGTRALLAARPAAAVAIAAFVNLGAAAGWAVAQGRDVVVVCAGELGRRSLEDEVCAGALVTRLMAAVPALKPTPAAEAAAVTAQPYLEDPARLAADAPHARGLSAGGRGADLAACLTLDTHALVPIYRPNVDKIVSASG